MDRNERKKYRKKNIIDLTVLNKKERKRQEKYEKERNWKKIYEG